ncbi:MAG: hypothetical protein Q4C41_03385 [Eggerthellaceae bacterium]|nr:hypothetical protein [Eggerthellaceae bacterium]
MATIGNDAVGEERVAFGALSVADLLLDAGFVLMLAWHYLVLFSSVFGDLASGDVFGYLYMRQLVLYLSLAVTFGGIWLFARFRSKRGTARSASVMTVYLAGLLALVVSAVYSSVVSAQLSEQIQLAVVALLGFSEGLLMYLWLHCFVEKRGERFSNPFAIDMVAGALLAFLICCFQWPVGPVATAIAPFVSSLVLAREKRLAGLAKSAKSSKAGKAEKLAKASAASDCDVEASGKGAHDLDAQKTVRGGGRSLQRGLRACPVC